MPPQALLLCQLHWAVKLDIPVILHIREAFADAFDTLRRVNLPQLRGVFHSFTGTREELEEALSFPSSTSDQWGRDV